jgi:hypothetical protein
LSNNKLLPSLIIVLILFAASCTLVSLEDDEVVYPTIIEPLNVSLLQQKNSEYRALNNDHICSTLNEYGYTGFSRVLFPNDVNPCLSREIIRIELTETDTLEAFARKVLYKNRLFTGVLDTTTLEITESVPLFGCTICEGPDINNVIIEWKVTFAAQQVNNVALGDTEISVFMDAFGVNRIWGNWFNGFYNPDRPNISADSARALLVGQELTTQTENLNVSFTIQDSFISTDEIVEIRPYPNNGNLEIRKGYVFDIVNPELQGQSWQAFIDQMDGKILSLTQI